MLMSEALVQGRTDLPCSVFLLCITALHRGARHTKGIVVKEVIKREGALVYHVQAPGWGRGPQAADLHSRVISCSISCH